jgi:hypothetical protein
VTNGFRVNELGGDRSQQVFKYNLIEDVKAIKSVTT